MTAILFRPQYRLHVLPDWGSGRPRQQSPRSGCRRRLLSTNQLAALTSYLQGPGEQQASQKEKYIKQVHLCRLRIRKNINAVKYEPSAYTKWSHWFYEMTNFARVLISKWYSVVHSLQNKIFFLLDIRSTKYLAIQHICWTEPKVAGPKKTVVKMKWHVFIDKEKSHHIGTL